MITS
ncbi:hypothetical protein MTR67_031719 [Solanum verrucosum]